MASNIFKSKITLSYSDSSISKDYQLTNYPTLAKSNKILSIIQFILLLGSAMPFLLNNFIIKKLDKNLFYTIISTKSIFLFVDITTIILSFLPKQRPKLHKGISIFLYLSFFLLTFEIKEIFNRYTNMAMSYFNFVYFVEFLIICFWHFLKLLEFKESFFVNIALLLFSFILVYCIPAKSNRDNETLITIIVMSIGIILSSYMITNQAKSSFYYFYQMKKKNKWYENIMNNLNTGFIHIENNKIAFINNTLIEKIKVFKKFENICKGKNNSIDEKSSKELLELLLYNISNKNSISFGESHNNTSGTANLNNNNTNNNCQNRSALVSTTITESERAQLNNDIMSNINDIEINVNHKISKSQNIIMNRSTLQNEEENNISIIQLITRICHCNKSENFSYIGRGKIMYESNTTDDELRSNELVYEILTRYESDDHFQIIFDDITRTKLYEEKSAEFKYKNLLLAKIAHEFKNPIICIMELADELVEKEKINKKSNKEISLISTFSDYLLILIKDLDYFSSSQMKKNTQITKTKVFINELCTFCNQIANALIKKGQKQNYIKFIVQNNHNLDYIETDDIKIKQILINLLSNAIKFTNLGSITLDISMNDNGSICFSVIDTGKGIKSSQKKSIFTPFAKFQNDNNNKFGAGLGLSIAYDLAKKIGSGLYFTSQLNKGSKFWFSVNGHRSLKTMSSDKTVYQINQPLKCNINADTLSDQKQLIFSSMNSQPLNIILVDDEFLPRKANIRIINRIAKEKNTDINIIEAEDGIETLKIIYDYTYKKNERISAIISDETMKLLSGVQTAEVLGKIFSIIEPIPFYLVTAYERMTVNTKSIKKVFSKPLRQVDAELIFSSII